jgi:glycosyltransferase involved in cell wall biosynthesis
MKVGMRALTVAMFSESYLPRISGVTTSIESFSRALRADGHQVLIVAPRYRRYRDVDPDVLRLSSITPPGQPDFPLAVPYRVNLFRDLRGREVDIVHAHSPFIMGRLALSVARRLRRPLVFTHHTMYHEYVHYVPWIHRDLSRRLVLRYTRAFANRCDVVIAPSAVVSDLLRAQGVTARIEVLPSGGVDLERFARLDGRAVRARHEIPADRPLLVTVSRLAPEKSVDLVLQAFQQVPAGAEAYLLIVGGGPSAEALQDLARALGIAARTRFTGPLPHDAALEAIAGADLFLFGSQTETQGIVLVEAMAAGVPVVAVARGGAAEVVGDGEAGVLVEPSPQAMAAAVHDLMVDPARRRTMSRRAREIAAGYATPVLARRIATLYQSVLAEKEGHVPQRT